MIQVTYFHHSGFMVETENNCLIFDYFTENGKYDFLDISKYSSKKIVVFVSHFHQDHYDRKIFDWQKTIPQIQYVLSDDVTPIRTVQNVHKVHGKVPSESILGNIFENRRSLLPQRTTSVSAKMYPCFPS